MSKSFRFTACIVLTPADRFFAEITSDVEQSSIAQRLEDKTAAAKFGSMD